MLFNIHSHTATLFPSEKKVLNYIVPLDVETAHFPLFKEELCYSLGIHPWYIDEDNISKQFDFLEKTAQKPTVKLIGECGLDRLQGPPYEIQKEVFLRQIDVAETLEKPVIIHCVRRFNELIEIIKHRKPKVPLVVHGFNKNLNIATQLLEIGMYLSFGAALLKADGQAAKVVAAIPINRLFLETDDSAVEISAVYETVAKIRKLPLPELIAQVDKNLERILQNE